MAIERQLDWLARAIEIVNPHVACEVRPDRDRQTVVGRGKPRIAGAAERFAGDRFYLLTVACHPDQLSGWIGSAREVYQRAIARHSERRVAPAGGDDAVHDRNRTAGGLEPLHVEWNHGETAIATEYEMATGHVHRVCAALQDFLLGAGSQRPDGNPGGCERAVPRKNREHH